MNHFLTCFLWLPLLATAINAASLAQAGVNYEEAPIFYSVTSPENRISRLQQRLAAGEVALKYEEPTGYLRSLLHALEIPVSSQVLNFSKTSLQKDHIGPLTPRAIYFNDEVHLGYVQHGVIEIAVTDPQLGMVFYTLDQQPDTPPKFQQRTNNCLTCHSSGRTRNVPGLQVRSVYPDAEGQPVVAAGSFASTHASPLAQRWGGWYVTGTHGSQTHLGNFTLAEKKKPKTIENAAGQNVRSLTDRFDTLAYLTPHSDIVALMVLEHQADTLNALTAAGFEVRLALHQHATSPANSQRDEQIERAAVSVVKSLLFAKEASLTAPVQGTSDFVTEFARTGRRDRQGRSLRDFDLETRMFRYPCSYLIDTPAFHQLPVELRTAVYLRLKLVLGAESPPEEFAHLNTSTRTAVAEVLQATLPELASAWSERP